MPLSISDFRNKINENKSVAITNRFEVTFSSGTNSSLSNTARNLTYFCELAELPGRSLLTADEKIYGPIRKIPYGSSYIETNMTFLCTSDGMKEKRFFDSWMDLINNPISHDVNYYDSYVQNVNLSMFNETNSLMYACTFYECYPTLVSSLSLNASANDYARINVTFAYRYWLRNDDNSTDINTTIRSSSDINRYTYNIGENA